MRTAIISIKLPPVGRCIEIYESLDGHIADSKILYSDRGLNRRYIDFLDNHSDGWLRKINTALFNLFS